MADSLYKQALDQVQRDVCTLALDGVDDANIVVLKNPATRKDHLPALPGILIFPTGIVGVNAGQWTGTNERDDVTYPIGVLAIEAGNQNQTANLNRHLTWLQRIRREFSQRRLSNIAASLICTVDPQETLTLPAFLSNYDASGLIIRAIMREARS